MFTLRRAADRGHQNHGWLDTHHTFSFADYYDPHFMGFGVLRVVNDDVVGPGGGFPPHDHRDMEILTYILEGALAHKDSMGNGSIIRPGDLQRMSAGTGVRHSEENASRTEPVHLLQIWLVPRQRSLPPSYEQKHFADDEKRGTLRLLAAPDGAEGAVRIAQDARLFASLLAPGEMVSHAFADGRKGWLHVARGTAEANGITLIAGDGLAIDGERELRLDAKQSDGELLLFDLPH